MIAPLRSRHRWMTTLPLLAVAALVMLAPGIEPARMDALPDALFPESSPIPLTLVFESDSVFESPRIRVEVHTGKIGDFVALTPQAPLARPDVLVYWSAETVTSRIGEDAILLGVLGERAAFFPLPSGAWRGGGHLVLWSLGHGEVVASGALARPEDAP